MGDIAAGARGIHIELEGARLERVARHVVEAINSAQRDGFTIDEVLCAALYMLGAAIKQRGAKLYVDKPLRVALPPIVQGYEEAQLAEEWQITGMQGL